MANNKTINNCVYDHAIDLIIMAFFFAMRACEYTLTSAPGKTRRVTLGSVVFRDKHYKTIPHNDPNLLSKAFYVTITFQDQKNGTKLDSRTHQRTNDLILCPVF
jgi:hypothetical protein